MFSLVPTKFLAMRNISLYSVYLFEFNDKNQELSLTALKNMYYEDPIGLSDKYILLIKRDLCSFSNNNGPSLFIALALYYIKVFHFRSRPPGLPTHTTLTALSQQAPAKT